MDNKIESKSPIDLRLGRWQDALRDVESCDAVICDPPYSERTHSAQQSDAVAHSKSFEDLKYVFWTKKDVSDFVGHWSKKCNGWFVVFSDHALQIEWERLLEKAGRYVFAPIPQVTTNRSVRLCGDGPACWTTWITVARPKKNPYAKWGALDGAYIDSVGSREKMVVQGGKQIHTMRSIIRDYTKPGDLVVDPCAGGATTLIAAAMEGRRAIGAEMDPTTHAKAMRRISAGYTTNLPGLDL